MGLPKTGVRLVAEGASGFFGTMKDATQSVNKFERNTKSAGAGTIAFGVAIGNLAAGALTTVTGLLIDAGRAAVGFVGGSIQMAGELEAQMSGVAAVMGATNEDLELLNELVIDLGIDPNLKVSSVEAAQAIEVLAKNGVELEDILGGVARQTVFLANATGADFAIAADIATDAMNIFGFKAGQMGDVVDGVSAVVQSSKFDVNDFALALSNGGSTAASVGVSFDDFTTALVAISEEAGNGQKAGTALRNLLLRLTPATEKAEDAMRDLGLITADGANVFFDAAGNMRGLEEITGELQKAFGGLSDEQKIMNVRTIFGQDALAAVNGLVAIGADEFGELAHAMSQVDAGEAASTRVDNFAGVMDILDGVIESVRLQLGKPFLDPLSLLATKFSELIESGTGPLIESFKDMGTFLSTFFLALDLGVGPLEALRIAFSNIIAGGSDTFFSKLAETALIFFDILDGGRTPVQGIFDALTNLGVTKDIAFAIVDGFIKLRDTFITVKDFIIEHKDAIILALTNIGIAFAIGGIILGVAAAITFLMNPLTLLMAGIALLSTIWAEDWGNIQTVTEQSKVIIVVALKRASTSAKQLAQVVGFTLFNAFNQASVNAGLLAKVVGFKVFEALNKASVSARLLHGVIVGALLIASRWLTEQWEKATTAASQLASIMEMGVFVASQKLTELWDEFTTAGSRLLTIVLLPMFGALNNAAEGARILRDAVAELIRTLSELVIPSMFQESSPSPMTRSLMNVTEWSKNAAGSMEDLRASLQSGFSLAQVEKQFGRNMLLAAGGFGGIRTTGDQLGGGLLNRPSPISPPATGTQIRNATINNTINNSTVNFSGNFAGQPNITDRDALLETLGTL